MDCVSSVGIWQASQSPEKRIIKKKKKCATTKQAGLSRVLLSLPVRAAFVRRVSNLSQAPLSENPTANMADDEAADQTEGYKTPKAATLEDMAKLDANDDALTKWKASLVKETFGTAPETVLKQRMLTSSARSSQG